jgi:hypothetical protein
VTFADFTLQTIETRFGVTAQPAALFADAPPAPVPDWLRDLFARTLQLPLVSEKARSELIVMPVLSSASSRRSSAVKWQPLLGKRYRGRERKREEHDQSVSAV